MSNNVSYQLFNKQVGERNLNFNSSIGDNYMSVTPPPNDSATDNGVILSAFQQQFALNEYYKGPSVFDAIKKNYMDKSMENNN